jgi:hypothetical protein
MGERPQPDVVLVDLVVGVGGQMRADDGGCHQQRQHEHPCDRGLVAQQPAARVVPEAAALDRRGLDRLGALAGTGDQD